MKNVLIVFINDIFIFRFLLKVFLFFDDYKLYQLQQYSIDGGIT